MPVSYPKGVSGMSPAVVAPLSPPVRGTPAPPGGFAKALTHHGHVGKALKVGDAKKAMHHIGHMMLAIRNASPVAAPATATGVPMPDDSDGTDDGSTPATPPMAPTKKPFNRGVFSAMGSKR